eukprot:3983737-Karenia_brevis.AAC.1
MMMMTPESIRESTAEEKELPVSETGEGGEGSDSQYKSNMVAEQSRDPSKQDKPERDLGFLSKSSDE